MANAAEAAQAKQGMAAVQATGVETLSGDDSVVFTEYRKYVLPTDGSVFWVQTAEKFTIQGSLHYATQQNQAESETEGVNTVIFTALAPIQQFNAVSPETLWIGAYAGDKEGFDGPLTFAFSSRGRYYMESDLFHYSGIAVVPTLATQLVTSEQAVAQVGQIVSNSLPLWLAMNDYAPPYNNGVAMPLALYSSFLVPDNLAPPYAVVHVDPDGTESLEAAPLLNQVTSQYQLCRDKVRVTLYGANNSVAMMFIAALNQYSLDYDTIGMASTAVVRDEKRTSSELTVIAQKKTIDVEVNYYQSVVRDIAQQQFRDVINHYLPQPLTAVGFVPPAP